MSIVIESGAEPIPGYKLLHRLGSGGFGEVWAAEAPGGVPKAIKVLFGTLQGLAEDGGRRVRQELRSLRRIQDIRHPFLLSLERYDIVDGRLLIVMERAERSLAERFQECRSQGLPGIPRGELLRFLEEAAEVLDVMNLQHRLQHLDIKPQNLLLSVNHIKVADFGLVKYLEQTHATRTGGYTPVYAAPEMFQGTVSRYCDQYSLALVFQELLTGRRAFAATTLGDLARQHLNERPDLAPLPPEDREPVARALAKKATDRFASCGDFIRALRKPSTARGAQPRHAPRTAAGAEEDTMPEIITGDGILGPTLIIGLGGQGLQTLHELREMIHDRFGSIRALPTLRLLLIDTDPAADDVLEELLGADRTVRTPLHRPSHYLRAGALRPRFAGWLDARTLYQIPREPRTDGLRSLGRLALVDHSSVVARRLRSEIRACTDPAALQAAKQLPGLGLRSSRPRVWIVSSLAGGTGSGMLLDLAYLVRRQLRQLGYRQPEVIGLFLLPAMSDAGMTDAARTRALANSVAALTELNHFTSPGTSYTAHGEEDEDLCEESAPFERWWVIRPDATQAAAFLATELTTTLARRGTGSVLSATSPEPSAATAPVGDVADLAAERPPAVGTFGLYRIVWPRRQVVKQAARALCARLTQSWVAEQSGSLEEMVQEWLTAQWEKEGLGPERLIEHLEGTATRVLGEAPLDLVQKWIDTLGREAHVESTAVLRLQQRIRDVLGEVAVSQALLSTSGCALDRALDEAAGAWAADWAGKWGKVVWSMIDCPPFRFAGADAALRLGVVVVRETLAHHENLARELTARAEQVRQRIDPVLAALGTRRSWPESADALFRQAELHYRRKIMARVVQVFTSFPEVVSHCRREVSDSRGEIGKLFLGAEETEAGGASPAAGGLGTTAAVEQFLAAITRADLDEVDRDMQTMIERQYESFSRVCLLSSWSNRFEKLARSMHHQAAVFVQDRIGFPDILEKWFEAFPTDDQARTSLVQAFQQAEADLGPAELDAPRLEVLVLPASPFRLRLWDLAGASLPMVRFRGAAGGNEVVFYVEKESSGKAALASLGDDADGAYYRAQEPRHLSPHNRLDILQWLSLSDGW